MSWTEFDYWKFLAGLGIFMFGMFLLEEAIKQVSGRAFKTFIRKSTTGKLRAIGTGFLSTAVLQSSSAVTLMTLTFVGAGLISMQNAIGVVLGTNLGTTITSWLVATVGFKINIEGLFLPLIGIGGLGLIFLNKAGKQAGFSKLFVGLGFLFMGLDYMKLSVETFTAGFDLAAFPQYGLWFYLILGIILTSIMQSSSATIAIVLTGLNSGLLQFDQGAVMVIGANIGTTTTVMLGSLGGVTLKKQVAFSHLVFNMTTGVMALLLLPVLTSLVLMLVDETENAVIGVTLFHTIFNLLGVLLFLPFLPMFVKLIQKVYPEKANLHLKYISKVSSDLPEASEVAVKNETYRLVKMLLQLMNKLLFLEKQRKKSSSPIVGQFLNKDTSKTAIEIFEIIQKISNEIIVFSTKIQSDQLEASDKIELGKMNHLVMVVNQVSKSLMSVQSEFENLEMSDNDKIKEIFRAIKSHTKENVIVIETMMKEPSTDAVLQWHIGQLKAHYKKIVEGITDAMKAQEMNEQETADLLMINGFVTQSLRQLYRGFEHAN